MYIIYIDYIYVCDFMYAVLTVLGFHYRIGFPSLQQAALLSSCTAFSLPAASPVVEHGL